MSGTRDLRQTERSRGALPDGIPGVDAAALAGDGTLRDAAVGDVRRACLETGFFCLDNLLTRSRAHPRVLERMRHFFARPDDDPVKRAVDVTAEDNTNGWMPLFGEPAYQPGTLAHVESFDCGRPRRGPGDTTHRRNRWPAIPGFREDVQELWREFSDAGFVVLRAIADALRLGSGLVADSCGTQDLSTLRLLHYPPTDADPSSVGIAAHTDFECITLIVQTSPGLELRDRRGNWYDAPAGADRIIVLLGDMLERWTNGTLCATGHRVRSREYRRYSMVLFFAVDDDVVVEPLAPFVTADNPSAFGPVRQRDHTREELTRAESYRDEFAARPRS